MPELKDPNHNENKRVRLSLLRQSVNWLEKSWIGETWLENRVTFKLLAADAVKFLLIMASLSLGHSIIKGTMLPEERRQILETIHFNVLIIAWIWFGMIFILEITFDVLKRIGINGEAKKTNANKS